MISVFLKISITHRFGILTKMFINLKEEVSPIGS